MQKRMKLLKLGPSKFALLLILSIVTTAFSGCPEKPNFPDIPLYETAINPETNEWLCGEYKVTDAVNLKFTPVLDHSLNQCAGVFGFKTKDFPKIIEHFQAVEAYYKKKLDECEAR